MRSGFCQWFLSCSSITRFVYRFNSTTVVFFLRMFLKSVSCFSSQLKSVAHLQMSVLMYKVSYSVNLKIEID